MSQRAKDLVSVRASLQNSEPVQATVPRTKALVCDGEAVGGEFLDDGGDAGFGDVDEEKILHGRGAEVAVAVMFGEIGGYAELRGSDAAADDVGADGEEAGLLLRNDAEVIAMDGGGELFGSGGIELVAELGFDGG